MYTAGLGQVPGVQCVLGKKLEIGLGFRNEVATCLFLRTDTTLDISSVDDSFQACVYSDIFIFETVVGNIRLV